MIINCVYGLNILGTWNTETYKFKGNDYFKELKKNILKQLKQPLDFAHLCIAKKPVDDVMHIYNSIAHEKTIYSILFRIK